MLGLYNYWWRITSFESSPGKKETCMFYVDNTITFSVFLELLCKFTLLVRYKLNIFRPLHMNHFDINALLFGGYYRFIPLDKMVFYGHCKYLLSVSFSMLHIDLTLFLLCNGLCCSIYNYPLVIISIAFSTTCISIIYLVAETILFTWLLIIGENIWPSCPVTSVFCFKEYAKPLTKITSSSGNNFPFVVSCLVWDYIMYVSQYKNSHASPGPYLWFYYWDDDPVFNVFDLLSDGCLL